MIICFFFVGIVGFLSKSSFKQNEFFVCLTFSLSSVIKGKQKLKKQTCAVWYVEMTLF